MAHPFVVRATSTFRRDGRFASTEPIIVACPELTLPGVEEALEGMIGQGQFAGTIHRIPYHDS